MTSFQKIVDDYVAFRIEVRDSADTISEALVNMVFSPDLFPLLRQHAIGHGIFLEETDVFNPDKLAQVLHVMMGFALENIFTKNGEIADFVLEAIRKILPNDKTDFNRDDIKLLVLGRLQYVLQYTLQRNLLSVFPKTISDEMAAHIRVVLSNILGMDDKKHFLSGRREVREKVTLDGLMDTYLRSDEAVRGKNIAAITLSLRTMLHQREPDGISLQRRREALMVEMVDALMHHSLGIVSASRNGLTAIQEKQDNIPRIKKQLADIYWSKESTEDCWIKMVGAWLKFILNDEPVSPRDYQLLRGIHEVLAPNLPFPNERFLAASRTLQQADLQQQVDTMQAYLRTAFPAIKDPVDKGIPDIFLRIYACLGSREEGMVRACDEWKAFIAGSEMISRQHKPLLLGLHRFLAARGAAFIEEERYFDSPVDVTAFTRLRARTAGDVIVRASAEGGHRHTQSDVTSHRGAGGVIEEDASPPPTPMTKF